MKRYGTSIRFLISSALSLLGNSVVGIALPLIVLATTGDALAAGTTGSTGATCPSPPTSSPP